MFNEAFFWFTMGALFIFVAAGARHWARDLGLKMTWWKWLLATAWYGLLIFDVCIALTFAGENEAAAGLRIFLFLGIMTFILGVGLVRLLLAGRATRSS